MRIVFAGTPEFAATALRRLLASGFAVPLVLTQPDRPAGRGMRLTPGPVKQVALAAGIEVSQPDSLKRDAAAVARIAALAPHVMVVAAYGLMLPQAVLDIPPAGCLNIHASLLPRWRGAAPIQRAIEAGDAGTGVCIMRMEAGLDTGPVLLSAAVPIGDDDTAGTLHETLSLLGADLIVDALQRLACLPAVLQPAAGVTYAAKISKSEARLDFTQVAAILARKVRAFNPFPAASAAFSGQVFKVWAANPGAANPQAAVGQVIAADAGGIVIGCAAGTTLVLTELQRPGGKRLPAREFLQAFPLPIGTRLDAVPILAT